MHEKRFVSLADILRASPTAVESALSPLPAVAVPPALRGANAALPAPAPPIEAAALREARLFRAALADAFDVLVTNLARDIAADILARELCLAPADLEKIARRLFAERRTEEPLCLRVAPADAHITSEFPIVADPELTAGDAILVCRSGAIDARLQIRLANVLAAVEW